MKNRDKERVLVEVEHRMMDKYGRDPTEIEQTIFDTIYEEKQRLETERYGRESLRQGAFYRRIYKKATRANIKEQREILRELVQYFGEEVSGHFEPLIYGLATLVVPRALNVMLNAMSPIRLLGAVPSGLRTLSEQIEFTGETEALKSVAERGTTILVSTHQSNLDSLVLGFSLYRLGLPPYTYGAGLNLFHNKMIGFFMHNLGAYKVDRRKTAELYKDVLKTYAGCTMELGYHNMFFPGGTRSRSGSVENRLKMGLLGMGLDAYIHNLQVEKEKPDIFVIPCTINYPLVLEAETLIDDHLKEQGKSRYIIEDDEFSRPQVVLDFARKLFSLRSKILLNIGEPMDVFGNRVDREGISRDSRGRPIDRRRYVFKGGQPQFDPQRDGEYTRELARSIVQAFHRDTVIRSTSVVARVVYQWLLEQNREMGLYRLLRTGGSQGSMPLKETYGRLERLLKGLVRLEKRNGVGLGRTLKEMDIVYVLNDAIAHWTSFHRTPALSRRGDRIYHEDRNLLLYYQNRLEGFGL